jgi:hypothetical protein
MTLKFKINNKNQINFCASLRIEGNKEKGNGIKSERRNVAKRLYAVVFFIVSKQFRELCTNFE